MEKTLVAAKPANASPIGRPEHLLIVDDDPQIGTMLSEYFSAQGYRVTAVPDGAEMAQILAETKVDLILLDLHLPGEDGLMLARRVRTDSQIPIIMLTAAGQEIDRVLGLEMGADDYIAKPFNIREVYARVKAVLRRAKPVLVSPDSADGKKPGRYAFAGWELSMRSRRLRSPQGESIPLTNAEFSLLAAFVQRPSRVLSREQLLDFSRVHSDEVFDRAIDVQVLRLRRKIEADPQNPQIIKTERGAGYIFAPQVERF
jgi:two-component system, OmpR family, response regulator